jgi:hypothetical protein
MATIVVEDGTGKTNSNSYISEADLTTYATDRGITISGTNAVLLIQAMDYIESLDFVGNKNTDAQALQWPRYGVVIDGYSVGSDEIPQLLIDATAEVALGIDGGVNPLAVGERDTVREKVDVIEVEYSSSASSQQYLRAANAKLNKLLNAGGSSLRTIRV